MTKMTNHNYLIHYASPYYDPVKAHEYYMRTRELKGTGGKTLHDEGKAAVRYVKEHTNNDIQSLQFTDLLITDELKSYWERVKNRTTR